MLYKNILGGLCFSLGDDVLPRIRRHEATELEVIFGRTENSSYGSSFIESALR